MEEEYIDPHFWLTLVLMNSIPLAIFNCIISGMLLSIGLRSIQIIFFLVGVIITIALVGFLHWQILLKRIVNRKHGVLACIISWSISVLIVSLITLSSIDLLSALAQVPAGGSVICMIPLIASIGPIVLIITTWVMSSQENWGQGESNEN